MSSVCNLPKQTPWGGDSGSQCCPPTTPAAGLAFPVGDWLLAETTEVTAGAEKDSESLPEAHLYCHHCWSESQGGTSPHKEPTQLRRKQSSPPPLLMSRSTLLWEAGMSGAGCEPT